MSSGGLGEEASIATSTEDTMAIIDEIAHHTEHIGPSVVPGRLEEGIWDGCNLLWGVVGIVDLNGRTTTPRHKRGLIRFPHTRW